MTKLSYDNIFESVEPNKKKAARMQGASDALIDLASIMQERGSTCEEIKSMVNTLRDRVFARYH